MNWSLDNIKTSSPTPQKKSIQFITEKEHQKIVN